MTIKTIMENIEELAMEDMTEDGIHKDDMPDHDQVYKTDVLNRLSDLVENNG